MTVIKYVFEPQFAVPPGETLLESIEALGMSKKDFAQRLGLTVQSLIRIFKGTQSITPETANKLEMVTGTPAHFWNALETQYREQLDKLPIIYPQRLIILDIVIQEISDRSGWDDIIQNFIQIVLSPVI